MVMGVVSNMLCVVQMVGVQNTIARYVWGERGSGIGCGPVNDEKAERGDVLALGVWSRSSSPCLVELITAY